MQESASSESVLYMSASDIKALHIGPREVIDTVSQVLRRYAEGRAIQGLKTTVKAPSGDYFQALPSILPDQAVAGVKWVSIVGRENALSGISATILLTSLASGRLLAILDGGWVTASRTAAMSAIAARALAKRNSRTIGFIGCGIQAVSHLDALKTVFPTIERITAFSRSQDSALRFCDVARSQGLSASIATTPREAVEGQDIVISSVPAAGIKAPFLDANWIENQSFASLVDLGRSWVADTLGSVDIVATDDRAQSSILAADGKLFHGGPYHYDLAELDAAGHSRFSGPGRRILIFGGMGICDAAVAALCYDHAVARGSIGLRLPANR
ncbi:MAG: ornithine cyclodeaminase family protein [Rhodospirillales bacterium]|nr:ornithine cyclodeaminase family protein [Rhodospirillales bacterium]